MLFCTRRKECRVKYPDFAYPWPLKWRDLTSAVTGRLLTLGRQRTPQAIGGLVAAQGDEDEQLRWLAALSLHGIGGGTVIATLKAFIDQAPSAVPQGCYAIAREEAEKVLGKLEDEA